MVFIIAGIFALRIFGFMSILPVIANAAVNYEHYSLFLVGLSIGIYGLVQAIFHIPMGYLSDKIGRKVVVLFGLLLMLIGSIIAAKTNNMYGIIIGRAIQGSGAIGSVLNAWCTDFTKAEDLTKAMAIIGITIGATFLLSIVLGPIIINHLHLNGLFFITAILSILAMILTMILPESNIKVKSKFSSHIIEIIRNKNILKIDYGIFMLHASYTALFLVIPQWVKHYTGAGNTWHLYLPIILLALLISLPAMFLAESRGYLRQILLFSASSLLLSNILFLMTSNWLIPLLLYLASFTVMESLLPSLLSKFTPLGFKGTAMGVFSCAQYLGIFLGGALGGFILNNAGINFLLYFSVLITIIWLILALKMPIIVVRK